MTIKKLAKTILNSNIRSEILFVTVQSKDIKTVFGINATSILYSDVLAIGVTKTDECITAKEMKAICAESISIFEWEKYDINDTTLVDYVSNILLKYFDKYFDSSYEIIECITQFSRIRTK